jgi:hypothetical protein
LKTRIDVLLRESLDPGRPEEAYENSLSYTIEAQALIHKINEAIGIESCKWREERDIERLKAMSRMRR